MARQAGRWLLLIGALGLAVLGQYYFAHKPNYLYDGLVFYGLAVVLFLILLRPPQVPGSQTRGRPLRFTAEAIVRAVPVTAGLLLALAAVIQLNEQRQNYWPVFWTWVAGSLLYLLGFARWPEWSWRAHGRTGSGGGMGRRRLPTGLRVPDAGAPGVVSPWAQALIRLRPLASSQVVEGVGEYGDQPSAAGAWTPTSPVSPAGAVAAEWLLVTLLVAGAFFLRAWHVDSIPWTLSGDEGNFGLYARAVLAGEVKNMFVTGHLSMPTMYSFFQAAWLKLVGDNIMGLRLPWAVLGTLSVLATYLLVRRLFGRNLALLAAFLLATYHYHIHYSRLGVNNISDPLFISGALYFLVLGWQARRRWAWAASGMVAGISFYFYTGARQVPLILLAALAYAVLVDRSFWREHKWDLLVMLGGFLVVFGPMGLVAWQHPDDFNARINEVGILQSGWLDQAVRATGRSSLSLLADQVLHAFLAFNLYTDRVAWYGAGIPLMDFAASIFMVLGVAFSVSRSWPAIETRDHKGTEGREGNQGREENRPVPALPWLPGWRYAVFVIWFVVVLGLGGVLTENPPSSQRLISSAVPAVFFVAVALAAVTRALGDLLRWSRLDRTALAATLAAGLALISVRYYFGPYQVSWAYGSTNAEIATRIGYYLRDLGPAWHEYFFGAPRMYADFGSTPFIARGVALTDVVQPLVAPFSASGQQQKLVFLFLPERAGELQWVQQTYPRGILEPVHRVGQPDGPLLFIAYRVD